MARDIALIEPDLQVSDWWVSYLVEQLEGEFGRRGERWDFDEMWRSLQNDLDYNNISSLSLIFKVGQG